jgi:hypothetical protein
MRKKKPDTDLSAFCVTRSVTTEADLLTCVTTSGPPTLLGKCFHRSKCQFICRAAFALTTFYQLHIDT